MKKTNRTTRNPKKCRKLAKAMLNRQLTTNEALRLCDAAFGAGAPVMALNVINMRGGITVAEAETLVRFINIEAEANGSPVRIEMKRGK